ITNLGNAGEVAINADTMLLDNSYIMAQTESGEGGNITLDLKDFLLLRNSSRISSQAGTEGGGGNGGNININIPEGFIIATPKGNSDITANAFKGKGGRVGINAAGIFGITPLSRAKLEELRPDDLEPSKLPTSDITATGATSDLSGTVEIITPQTDPTSGSIEFPTIPVETEVADACSTPGYAQSSFTITGKGSLPPVSGSKGLG
ncbi:MAG: filamentous hemagglutinin, partial [Cyanobacteria bacterium J06621_15]